MKRTLLFLFILFVLVSCDKAKQLARMQKNHSYLFEKTIDSVNYIDTILTFVDSIRFDTNFVQSNDTVNFTAGDIDAKIFIQDSIVYVDIFKPARTDTILINDTIQIPRFIPNVPPRKEDDLMSWIFQNLLTLFLIILALLIIPRARSWLTNRE